MKYGLYVFLVALSLFVCLVFLQSRYFIPKVVWTHWDDAMPPLIAGCLANTRRVLSDWEVRHVTTADFLGMCPADQIPRGFDDLIVQHKADYIRAWLLATHGGVWMDISTVLNVSLNGMRDACTRQRAELAGFFLGATTVDPRYPVFENWFIMAPRGSDFMARWHRRYFRAIEMGLMEYKTECRQRNIQFHKLMGREDSVYHTQHLCFQDVLQTQNGVFPANILFFRAEDSMFAVQNRCWVNPATEKECMKTIFTRKNVESVPFIKLTGNCRKYFPADYFTGR